MELDRKDRQTWEYYRTFNRRGGPTLRSLFVVQSKQHAAVIILMAVGIGCLAFLFQMGGSDGWGPPEFVGLAAIGCVFVGMMLGLLARDLENFLFVTRSWHVFAYVIDWSKVDEVLEKAAPPTME